MLTNCANGAQKERKKMKENERKKKKETST
jgi:hypothetical protein